MNSLFQEEHRIFRRSVRGFVEEELNPHVDKWEEEGIIPKKVFKKMGELGFLGIRYPRKFGGTEFGMPATVVFCEELGKCRSRGLTMSILVHTDMASPHLAYHGSNELKEQFLPAVIRGEKICSIALTEPGSGSDLAAIRTTAKREGDHYILNGNKVFITNAINSDLFFVLAKTSPEEGHKGMSMFLVEKGTPGFSITKMTKKLGMHASDTGELAFENCRVPAKNLLGEENKGFYQALEHLQLERFTASVVILSSAKQALDDAVEYAKDRELFGKKLAQFQITRHQLAKLRTKLAATKQLLYHTCRLFGEGKDPTMEVSMCKALAADIANEVADRALQIHGGYGYMEEYDIARFYRDIRLWKIGAGTTETMYEIIAKKMGI